MDLGGLALKWREEAGLLRRYGDARGAAICELHAAELSQAVHQQAAEVLTLSEASLASGYSERALRQMLADKKLPNAGRKHAPRIRRADLPRKPRAQDAAVLTAAFKARLSA